MRAETTKEGEIYNNSATWGALKPEKRAKFTESEGIIHVEHINLFVGI